MLWVTTLDLCAHIIIYYGKHPKRKIKHRLDVGKTWRARQYYRPSFRFSSSFSRGAFAIIARATTFRKNNITRFGGGGGGKLALSFFRSLFLSRPLLPPPLTVRYTFARRRKSIRDNGRFGTIKAATHNNVYTHKLCNTIYLQKRVVRSALNCA